MKNIKNVLLLSIILSLFIIGCQRPDETPNPKNYPTLTASDLPSDLLFVEVTCDDSLNKLLEQGGVKSTYETGVFVANLFKDYEGVSITPNSPGASCSAFIAKGSDGGFYAGRNFDWGTQSDVMIIRNKPTNGDYASISSFNTVFVNFTFPSTMDEATKLQIMARTGIFVPLDGVNEKGLVVAVLDQENSGASLTDYNEEGKKHLTITTAVRLLLNKAANVEEAVTLLQSYNMHSDIGTVHHLFIADATGKAVTAEWDNNDSSAKKGLRVTETKAVTNHPLFKYEDGKEDSDLSSYGNSVSRYRTILNTLAAKNDVVTFNEAKDILHSVHQDGWSVWSIVYHITPEYSEETFYWKVCENWETKTGYKFSVK